MPPRIPLLQYTTTGACGSGMDLGTVSRMLSSGMCSEPGIVPPESSWGMRTSMRVSEFGTNFLGAALGVTFFVFLSFCAALVVGSRIVAASVGRSLGGSCIAGSLLQAAECRKRHVNRAHNYTTN